MLMLSMLVVLIKGEEKDRLDSMFGWEGDQTEEGDGNEQPILNNLNFSLDSPKCFADYENFLKNYPFFNFSIKVHY